MQLLKNLLYRPVFLLTYRSQMTAMKRNLQLPKKLQLTMTQIAKQLRPRRKKTAMTCALTENRQLIVPLMMTQRARKNLVTMQRQARIRILTTTGGQVEQLDQKRSQLLKAHLMRMKKARNLGKQLIHQTRNQGRKIPRSSRPLGSRKRGRISPSHQKTLNLSS